MIAIPPKMQAAIDRGDFRPVVTTEITTAVLDAPAAQQSRRYFGTVEGKEGVELLYPAQPGDPTQTETLVYQGFAGTLIPGAILFARPRTLLFRPTAAAWDWDNSDLSAYRTFTVNEDLLAAHRLKRVTVRLRRSIPISSLWRLRARLYVVNGDGLSGFSQVLPSPFGVGGGFGGGLQSLTDFSPSTLTQGVETDVAFEFDVNLVPGRQYAVLLHPEILNEGVFLSKEHEGFGVSWMAAFNKTDFSERSVWGTTVLQRELSLKVEVAAYSYNGVTNPYVDVGIDLNVVPLSEGFIDLVDFLPSWIDPVTGTAKKTDIDYHLWAGDALWSTDVDLGAVTSGFKINVFRRFYFLRAALRTPETTTLIRTPLFKKVNVIFPQVVAGAPRNYLVSSHPLPFSMAATIVSAPAFPTKLNQKDYTTLRGGTEVSYVDANGEMTRIATEAHLLNLPVEVRVGHADALTKEDLMVVFQGIVSEAPYQRGLPTFKIEDRTKQLSQKIPRRSIKSVDYIASGGVANAYTLTFSPPFTAYTDRALFLWKPHAPNTTGATVDVDGLGPVTIQKLVGGVYVGLDPGDLPQGRNIQTMYEAAGPRMVLLEAALLGPDFRRDYRGKHLIDVLLEIITNDCGISRRWINAASFESARVYLDADDAVSKWITHYVLTEPTEAKELVNEILALIGCYLVVREDGLLTLVRFPRSDASVAEWDDLIIHAGNAQPEGLASSIVNACVVFYDRDGDGEQNGIALVINPQAQDDWAPGAEVHNADRVIKSRWLGPEVGYHGRTLGERIGLREIKARSNGMAPHQCRTNLSQFGVRVGDYVSLTSEVYLRRHELGMVGRQFMVVSKDPKWGAGRIDWELVEVVDANRPPTASFTVSAEKGLPPLTINFDGTSSVDPDGTILLYEWDFDYDGENFTVDAVGSTASYTYPTTASGIKMAALRVTDNHGAVHVATRLIKVLAPPVARIDFEVSDPTQPLFAMLSSGSFGVSGAIVKVEWDLSYDGSFNADVIGNSAVLNLPYLEITVAMRVTDEDGLTGLATLSLAGKAFAPSAVTGFFVDQISDKLVFHWNVNPETDLYGYEVREGATWNTSIRVADEILTNSFTTVAPTQPGSRTYLIKAINTTGRRSINATSITMMVFDGKDRNVLVTVDRKAQAWPGTKTGLVYEVAGDRWWINSIDDATDDATEVTSEATEVTVLRGTRVSGSYEGPPVDLGAIVEGNRLSIPISTELVPDPEGVSAITEYAESDDGVTYTPLAQISQSDLGFRYVKEKITLSNDDGASNIALESVVVVVDVPDVEDFGNDVSVAATGTTTVLFNRTFNVIPAITSITIQDMSVALYYRVNNITKTGFDVQIFRASDNVQVAAVIDWSAKKY